MSELWIENAGPDSFAPSRLMPDESRERVFALTGKQHGVQINAEGMQKYLQSWEVNHQLHPDIDAPDPWQVQEAKA